MLTKGTNPIIRKLTFSALLLASAEDKGMAVESYVTKTPQTFKSTWFALLDIYGFPSGSMPGAGLGTSS